MVPKRRMVVVRRDRVDHLGARLVLEGARLLFPTHEAALVVADHGEGGEPLDALDHHLARYTQVVPVPPLHDQAHAGAEHRRVERGEVMVEDL